EHARLGDDHQAVELSLTAFMAQFARQGPGEIGRDALRRALLAPHGMLPHPVAFKRGTRAIGIDLAILEAALFMVDLPDQREPLPHPLMAIETRARSIC